MAKILIVEDDDDIRTLLTMRLRKAGHRIVDVASCAEARAAIAERGTPEVLVCDVTLPGESGLDFVRTLREDPSHRDLGVVFLSGRVEPADIEAGKALEAVYLTKPVIISALNAAIEQVTAHAPAQAAW